MAAEYLPWPDAVEVICAELEQYQIFRRDGLAPDEAAGLLGISPATARRYDAAIARLVRDLKNGTAPGATEAAPALERTEP